MVSTKEFTVNLSSRFIIEDQATDFIVLSDARFPIPSCNTDIGYSLPGDGTVSGFVTAVGETVGEAAIEAVLNHLGIGQYVSVNDCSLPQTNPQPHALGKSCPV